MAGVIIKIVLIVAFVLLLAFLAWWFWPIATGRGCRGCGNLDPLPRPINTITTDLIPLDVRSEWAALTPAVPPNVQLPSSFDARQKWPNLITGAIDQGGCGSCWAFSTATAIGDRLRIVNPGNQDLTKTVEHIPFAMGGPQIILNSLNPYDLVNCDLCSANESTSPATTQFMNIQGYCNFGCDGGVIPYAYEYVKNIGLHTIDCDKPITCNPIESNGGTGCPCDVNDPNCQLYKISDYYSVVSDSMNDQQKQLAIKNDVFANGPVTIAYTVYNSFQTFFQNNPTGVYTQAYQDTVGNDFQVGGHAVDIIGWGTDPQAGDYWLVRNSWSQDWGDQGLFRIQYNWKDVMSQVWGARL